MAVNNSSAHFASASLYVGDLHNSVSEAMLYEVFNSVGAVASIRVCRDSTSRKSLGYAYVNYHSMADAERALDNLNYTHIKNIPCRLMWSQRDPSLRKSGTGNIFVKNLDRNIDNKALYDTFSLFGNILSCKVSQDESGKSRGFGFVHYESDEHAQTAVHKVNGMQIGTKTVYVGPFKKRCERRSNADEVYTNVYIKNIPPTWDEEKIKNIFSEFGEVTSVALQTDSQERVFGYVNYEKVEDAKRAVDSLHQKKVGQEGTILDGDLDDDNDNEGDSEELKQEKKERRDAKKASEEDASLAAAAAAGEDGKEDSDNDDARGAQSEASANNGARSNGEGTPASGAESPGDTEDPARLYVKRFQPRAERNALLRSKFDQDAEQRQKKLGVNLFIKNIHDSLDDKGLRELFEKFGTITSAKVMRDDNGDSKGFGFVSFLSPDEGTRAVSEMHLKLVEDKPLYVGLHEKRDARLLRLQQKLRLPSRPRMPPTPNAMQYGTHGGMHVNGSSGVVQPSHMAYGGASSRASYSNYGGAPPGGGWSRGSHPRHAYSPQLVMNPGAAMGVGTGMGTG
eukprot:Lankesteria_metandrocarpae@DN4516_c1_g1_i1.p1